jgi:subtilisin family serine protease
MRKTSLILGVCSIAMLTACKKDLKPTSGIEEVASATRSDNPVAQAASDPYVSNEVLVKFTKGTSETGISNALARIGGNVQEKVLTRAMQRAGDEGFYVVHTPLAVLDAVAKMKGIERVEYAEPNYMYTHDATSNDTYYTNGSLWGMYGDESSPANQYGSQAAEAWAAGKTDASSVYIGIIDEGYMYTHADLSANAGKNPGEIADNGVDDDGNGYKDDVYGWDFDGSDNTVFDGTQDDHGTHVAGTIGAVGGNGIGVAGVCWNVKLLNAKFLGRRGGTTANAVKAVDYFTDLKTRHSLNIVATNNSWGGGGASSSLQAAIGRANNANILFIAAAGNSGYNIESTKSYPASYTNDNIIAVAAIASNGSLPSWSNYGLISVDLGAPGSGIYSTLPGKNGSSSYGAYSGTSMATPHVTGGAALYAAYHPGSSAADIKSAILGSVIPTSSIATKTTTGGRLNVSGF